MSKTTTSKYLKSRLYAAIAVLILLPGWMSASITLAAQPSSICAMSCCIAAGHCCCRTPHTRVKGHPFSAGSHINGDNVLSSCPKGCANPNFSTRIISFEAIKTASPIVLPSGTKIAESTHSLKPANGLRAAPSGPRVSSDSYDLIQPTIRARAMSRIVLKLRKPLALLTSECLLLSCNRSQSTRKRYVERFTFRS